MMNRLPEPSPPRRVLVFRLGHLGDTIAALPSLWAVREHFAGAHITMLAEQRVDRPYVPITEVLENTGLVDTFVFLPRDASRGVWRRAADAVRLLIKLRRARYDALVYLAPSRRTRGQVRRDRRCCRFAGIRQIFGMEGFTVLPGEPTGAGLPTVPHEADLLLRRLAASGVPVPEPGRGCMDLRLGEGEKQRVEQWRQSLGGDGGRPWVAVGPGSKMPAKVWPGERHAAVISALIARHDIWPVVFGGKADQALGAALIDQWGRGYNAAGALGIRAAAAALSPCRLYLGNDTGTTHLAAAVGVPCVAVYSSRDLPGLWYPYGPRHRVFRTTIDCEGCYLEQCIDRRMECILRIDAEAVLDACMDVLEGEARGPNTS